MGEMRADTSHAKTQRFQAAPPALGLVQVKTSVKVSDGRSRTPMTLSARPTAFGLLVGTG